MSYRERMVGYRRVNDVDGAMDFLEDVFASDEIERVPTETAAAPSERTPVELFRDIVAGFAPATSIEARGRALVSALESVVEPAPVAGRPLPFNALAFEAEDYERGLVSSTAGHYDRDRGDFVATALFRGDVIGDADSLESYGAIQELKGDGAVRFAYRGEVISGGALYFDLKLTLFTRHLMALASWLREAPEFARVAKALPFHFLLRARDHGGEACTYEIFRIRPEDLAEHPLRTSYETAAAPAAAAHPAAVLARLREAATADAREHRALAEACRQLPQGVVHVASVAHEALMAARYDLLAAMLRLAWRLGDQATDVAVDLTALALMSPFVPPSGDDDPLARARAYVAMLASAWNEVPEGARERLRPFYDKALEAVRRAPSAQLRILAFEASRGLHLDGIVGAGATSSWPDGLPPPPGYTRDVIAAVEALPVDVQPTSEGWRFVERRLLALGERGGAAVPLMLRLVGDEPTLVGVPLIARVALVLEALGVLDVPAGVRKAAALAPAAFPQIATWAQRGPAKAVATFEGSWQLDPNIFEDASAWEAVTHDSPEGLAALRTSVLELGAEECLMRVSAQGAGPRLRQLVALFADAAAADHRYDSVIRLLEPLEGLGPARASLLEYAHVADCLARIEREAADVVAEIEVLLQRYPMNATLLLLDVDYRARRMDLDAALTALHMHLAAVSEADIVYRKALAVALGADASVFAPEPLELYVFYRRAMRSFRVAVRVGDLVPLTGALRVDPFYRVLEEGFDVSSEERARERDELEREFGFLDAARDLDEAALREKLDPEDRIVTLLVADRLLRKPTPDDVACLVAFFGEIDDAQLKRELTGRLWPVAPDALLASPDFPVYLPEYVQAAASGAARATLIDDAVSRMHKLALRAGLRRLALGLDTATVGRHFAVLLEAFTVDGDHDGALRLLRRLREGMTPDDDRYPLLLVKMAESLLSAGDAEKAGTMVAELIKATEPLNAARTTDRVPVPPAYADAYVHARFLQARLCALSDRHDAAVAALIAAHAGRPQSEASVPEISLSGASNDSLLLRTLTAAVVWNERVFLPLRKREDFQALVGTLRGGEDVLPRANLRLLGRVTLPAPSAADARSHIVMAAGHAFVASGARVDVVAIHDEGLQIVASVSFKESVTGLALIGEVLYVLEDRRALNLVDVRDPTHPRYFDCMPTIGRRAGPLHVVDGRLVAHWDESELGILDVTDPRRPRIIEVVRTGRPVATFASTKTLYALTNEGVLVTFERRDTSFVEATRMPSLAGLGPEVVCVGRKRLYAFGRGDELGCDLWVVSRGEPKTIQMRAAVQGARPTRVFELDGRGVFFDAQGWCWLVPDSGAPRPAFRQLFSADGRYREVAADEEAPGLAPLPPLRAIASADGYLVALHADTLVAYAQEPGGIIGDTAK